MANALADKHDVSVLLLEKLLPKRFYPGGARVGRIGSSLRYRPEVFEVGRIDWFWGPRIFAILKAFRREKPEVVVLQWWTAVALHTYLLLAWQARRSGAKVIIEFHEVQDTGEAGLPLVGTYTKLLLPRLIAMTSGAIVHSEHDLTELKQAYGSEVIDQLDLEVVPHGPYDHITLNDTPQSERPADTETRVLFFGLIRPYKGLEDLIEAFDSLSDDQAQRFRLTVVGETWENWSKPAEMIEASPRRDQIDFVNRYVEDTEIAGFFADADVLVLPYRRGSSSGPLNIAMSFGMHVVMYAVGGLVEGVAGYEGAHLVAPDSVDGLRAALLEVAVCRSQRFDDPHSWDAMSDAIESLGTGG